MLVYCGNYGDTSPFKVILKFFDAKELIVDAFSIEKIAANLNDWQTRPNLQSIKIKGPFPLLQSVILVDMPGLLDPNTTRHMRALNTLYGSVGHGSLLVWWVCNSRIHVQPNNTQVDHENTIFTNIMTKVAKGDLLRVIVHKQVRTDMEMVHHYFNDIYHHISNPLFNHEEYPICNTVVIYIYIFFLRKRIWITSPIICVDSKHPRADLAGRLPLQTYLRHVASSTFSHISISFLATLI